MTEPEITPTTHTHSHGGSSPLTRKVGPAPVWVYMVGVAALYVAYRYYAASKASSTTAVDSSGSTIDSTAPVTNDGSGGGSGPVSSGTIVTGPANATSNAQWGELVAADMIANGGNPVDINNAISDYLNGKALSPTEQNIISSILSKYGPPPEGLIPITAAPVAPVATPTPVPLPSQHPTPTPHPPTGVPASKAKSYTVKSGDTLTSIANHFYGNSDWQKIYDANKAKIGPNPNLIHPGTVLIIPA